MKPFLMKASRQVFVLFVVFASSLMTASLGHCRKYDSRQLKKLPVRTYILDDSQDGLSGFAVYQEVAPEFWLQRQRRPPPSVQLCKYDSLGSHSWPPAAVCWTAPTPLQHPSLQKPADLAAAAPEVDLAAFKSQTSPAEIAEVRPELQTGFLAGIADRPIVKSVANVMGVMGVNGMPGLGTQTRTLLLVLAQFCVLPPPKLIFTAISTSSSHVIRWFYKINYLVVSNESTLHSRTQ